MKSEWRVSRNVLNGADMFIVYRLKDANAVDHSGNREYRGLYTTSEEEAENIAAELNAEEVAEAIKGAEGVN